MKIIYKSAINKFAAKHPEAGKKLILWVQTLEGCSAKSFSELKLTFRSVDYVPKTTIFDVGGNAYRVVTFIDYKTQRVFIEDVFTHAEYDKWTKDNRGK
jgi:mRNA interferase HigB